MKKTCHWHSEGGEGSPAGPREFAVGGSRLWYHRNPAGDLQALRGYYGVSVYWRDTVEVRQPRHASTGME